MRQHKYGKGECDRCGMIYKLSQLKYEWAGLKVCPDCWDPLPRQDFPRMLEAESTALSDPRPEHDELVAIGLVRTDNDLFGRSFNGVTGNAVVGEVIAA